MICKDCKGSGQVTTDTATCTLCGGTGQVSSATQSGRLGPYDWWGQMYGAGQSNVPKEVSKPLEVIITSTLHKDQRYDTCGDWYYAPAWWDISKPGMTKEVPIECLRISVSQLPDRREMFLIAIHELIEAFLCECAGVTEASVDDFDKNFESGWLETDSLVGNKLALPIGYPKEPGDHPDAPYYHQHQLATGIERILAAEAGVSWLEYEQHIQELSR